LTAHRTVALRIELARNPAVALAATVHGLALSLVYNANSSGCLIVRASSEYLENHNADPKPFTWTKSAGEILEKVARAKQALESQH